MIDFSAVKSFGIPEGEVSQFGVSNGVTLWQKNDDVVVSEPVVLISLAKVTDAVKVKCTIEIQGIQLEQITAYGWIRIKTAQLRSNTLTKDTTGRTLITRSSTNYLTETSNGWTDTYSWTLSSSLAATSHAYRAFLDYTDSDGSSKTIYSDETIKTSYNNLA